MSSTAANLLFKKPRLFKSCMENPFFQK